MEIIKGAIAKSKGSNRKPPHAASGCAAFISAKNELGRLEQGAQLPVAFLQLQGRKSEI